MQWLLQLLPQQKAKGQGNVQVGNVGGDFSNTQNNSNQTLIFIMSSEQQAMVPTPPTKPAVMPQAPRISPTNQVAASPSITDDQAYILKVMRHEEELGALAERFMKKQFQTTYVKGLSAPQARRVVLYIYKCAENRNAARQKTNA